MSKNMQKEEILAQANKKIEAGKQVLTASKKKIELAGMNDGMSALQMETEVERILANTNEQLTKSFLNRISQKSARNEPKKIPPPPPHRSPKAH